MELVPAKSMKTILHSPYWLKVVIIFFLGWVFINADRNILNPVISNIKAEFGLSNAQVGLINSTFFLAYALIQIPAGMIGDKLGRKAVLVPGFVLFGLLTGFTGLVASFGSFLALCALTGAGQGTYYGPQYAVSSEAIPKKYRSLGSAIINSGGAVGIALGLISSSYITLVWHYNWRTSFLVFSVPTILVGILIWFVIKEAPRQQRSASNVKVSLGFVFKNRNLIVSYIVLFCSLYGFSVILTWLPYFLQEERGLQGSQIGFVPSLIPWASIPGALLVSLLSDRIGRRKPVGLVLIPCAILSICGIAYFHNITLLMVALVFYGVTGKLALDPILVAFVADNAPPEKYSTVFGVYNFIGTSSSILAPYITGAIADKTGSMASGFYFAGVVLVVGLIGFLFAKEHTSASMTI